MVKLIFKVHLIFFLLVFITPAFGDDMEMGYIIEVSQSREYIQVNDHIFKVNQVEIDDGSEDLHKGNRQQLNEGSVVQIIIGSTKTVDYWEAEKVVLYTGEKKEQVVRSMEKDIPVIHNKTTSSPSKQTIEKKNSSPMVLEDLVILSGSEG